MTQRILIERAEEKSVHHYCRELEMGNILFFPSIPFSFSEENFSECAKMFLEKWLEPYSKGWSLGKAGIEPFQERKRLNIDVSSKRSFPGSRILRFFANTHLKESEQWVTSFLFDALIKKYGGRELAFPKSVGYSLFARLGRKMKQACQSLGMKAALRSPYDVFMLRFRQFLKESRSFQTSSFKDHWEFPPNSCWMLFTDQVSYTSLSNQSLLGLSFFIPIELLLYPEKSPLHILQRLSGKNLIDLSAS